MTFDDEVAVLCERGTRLSKKEAIAVFSRWLEAFPRGDTQRNHGKILRGHEAIEQYQAHEVQDFFAVFEYDRKIPITYSCISLRTQHLPSRTLNLAIIGSGFSWAMLFNTKTAILRTVRTTTKHEGESLNTYKALKLAEPVLLPAPASSSHPIKN
jgi:hypothetical protein